MAFANREGSLIPLRLYSPISRAKQQSKLPVLIYFHGGGFVIGSLQAHDILCRELARLSGVAVLCVDYRLAPEHPFPAAQNDAWDALQWLHQNADELGLDAQHIAVGGDSAGGTLAAVCAHLARGAAVPLALQLLIYPCTAGYAQSESRSKYAQDYLLEEVLLKYCFDSTLSREYGNDWRFAPLNAADFSGLAPVFLAMAECDPLHDEGMQYADALRANGVAVSSEIYRGVTHSFINMGRILPEARQFHRDAAFALKQAFNLLIDKTSDSPIACAVMRLDTHAGVH